MYLYDVVNCTTHKLQILYLEIYYLENKCYKGMLTYIKNMIK
jgi:hypothetical protein